MGIRFRCPNGHKLHVKAFLAGKRGICPHCGEKFQIPLDSDPELVKSSKNAPEPTQTASSVADVTVDSAPASTEIASQKPVAASVDVADPQIQAAGERPSIDVNVSERPSADVSDQPADNAPDRSADPAKPQPVEVAPVTPAQASSVVDTPAGQVDPIDEAPHAVWYVRPPSGGQFGPASADVMRSWITEGRVTADSLVWREGWPEWKQAGPLFPGVSNTDLSPSVSAVPQIVTHAVEGSSAELYRRRKSNKSTLMVVFMLLIACLVLFGALVYVVKFMN